MAGVWRKSRRPPLPHLLARIRVRIHTYLATGGCGLEACAAVLTRRSSAIEYNSVPPAEAAHFIFVEIGGWLPGTHVSGQHLGGHMSGAQISHLLPTYARVDLAFERGEGVWLVATDGERYLDFTSGVAVNALGHAHPQLVAAITAQAGKLWHVSNLYRVPEAERLAARLCAASFADMAFFANSGAEAMECAIKMARKCHAVSGQPERYRIITFEGAFHGRTLATLAAGGQKKYLDGFGPIVQGFDQIPFGDLAATRSAVVPETAAILIEPIMGEGGVRVVPPEFLRALRALCDENRLLLVFDEVQTGIGRTGELFGYQRCGVTPDIMGAGQGARRRLPARRLPCNRRRRQGHDSRYPWLDLWRQSACHGRGGRAA